MNVSVSNKRNSQTRSRFWCECVHVQQKVCTNTEEKKSRIIVSKTNRRYFHPRKQNRDKCPTEEKSRNTNEPRVSDRGHFNTYRQKQTNKQTKTDDCVPVKENIYYPHKQNFRESVLCSPEDTGKNRKKNRKRIPVECVYAQQKIHPHTRTNPA